MTDTPPAGYRKLPDGTRCRCIRLWQDGVGGFYCCRSSATLAFGDSLSQHCPNCEAQAAEIEKLREALHTPLAFIEALHENDPDDQIADNGMTVLDGLKQQAPSVIKTIRAALGETK